ncbi:hypothetical protein QFZ63_000269 [Streptomyces sp. B3I7]|nr:hypothetical protein [Streptomyces sp. B3I7]
MAAAPTGRSLRSRYSAQASRVRSAWPLRRIPLLRTSPARPRTVNAPRLKPKRDRSSGPWLAVPERPGPPVPRGFSRRRRAVGCDDPCRSAGRRRKSASGRRRSSTCSLDHREFSTVVHAGRRRPPLPAAVSACQRKMPRTGPAHGEATAGRAGRPGARAPSAAVRPAAGADEAGSAGPSGPAAREGHPRNTGPAARAGAEPVRHPVRGPGPPDSSHRCCPCRADRRPRSGGRPAHGAARGRASGTGRPRTPVCTLCHYPNTECHS